MCDNHLSKLNFHSIYIFSGGGQSQERALQFKYKSIVFQLNHDNIN